MSNERDPDPSRAPEPGWAELQAQLDELRQHVERMLTDTTDHAEVYAKFAGVAGAIVERAPAELVESVRSELGTMLRDLKLTGDAAD